MKNCKCKFPLKDPTTKKCATCDKIVKESFIINYKNNFPTSIKCLKCGYTSNNINDVL